MIRHTAYFFFFFFNDTATTEIYTLSLHDALPIYESHEQDPGTPRRQYGPAVEGPSEFTGHRSEEHTSELQSLAYLVCRLLLEKKKKITTVLMTYNSMISHKRQFFTSVTIQYALIH